MLSRRQLGEKVAAGAAVVLATGAARAAFVPSEALTTSAEGVIPEEVASDGFASTQLPGSIPTEDNPPATITAEAPWDILQPLAVGVSVAHGWRLSGLTGAVDGSCVVTLENERGRQNRIHVCRNDGKPQGLVYTKHFDLVVMNGGKGDLPTEESFGQAVAEVAHVLASNERNQQSLVSELMPHAERESMCGPTDCRLR